MAYVSKGRQEERFPRLPSGEYTAVLVETLLKNHQQFGDYQSVKWEIRSPDDYQGRFLWESFYFNHPDPLKAQEAEVRYETYMREVGGVEEGGKDHEHLFLNKVCILSVYRGEYEGRPYNKVNSRTLTTPQGSGVYLPHPPQAMADLLDDEIPI